MINQQEMFKALVEGKTLINTETKAGLQFVQGNLFNVHFREPHLPGYTTCTYLSTKPRNWKIYETPSS